MTHRDTQEDTKWQFTKITTIIIVTTGVIAAATGILSVLKQSEPVAPVIEKTINVNHYTPVTQTAQSNSYRQPDKYQLENTDVLRPSTNYEASKPLPVDTEFHKKNFNFDDTLRPSTKGNK